MCDSLLKESSVGVVAKSSRETEPEEPFWVRYVMEHSSQGDSYQYRSAGTFSECHFNTSITLCREESERFLCLGLGCVPLQKSKSKQHNLATYAINLNHHQNTTPVNQYHIYKLIFSDSVAANKTPISLM